MGRCLYLYLAFLWPFCAIVTSTAEVEEAVAVAETETETTSLPTLSSVPSWTMVWATVPNIVFSLSFMINSQINHLTEECTSPGNTLSETNFWKHQVVTAQNFGVSSSFCGIFSGHLNHQIEHHLFPFVNHCHLPYLAPRVKEVCRKHGVPYHEAEGYVDGFRRHFEHTKKMAKKDR